MTAERKAAPAADKTRSGIVNCVSELERVCDITVIWELLFHFSLIHCFSNIKIIVQYYII